MRRTVAILLRDQGQISRSVVRTIGSPVTIDGCKTTAAQREGHDLKAVPWARNKAANQGHVKRPVEVGLANNHKLVITADRRGAAKLHIQRPCCCLGVAAVESQCTTLDLYAAAVAERHTECHRATTNCTREAAGIHKL